MPDTLSGGAIDACVWGMSYKVTPYPWVIGPLGLLSTSVLTMYWLAPLP
jgi:hypothetical protein